MPDPNAVSAVKHAEFDPLPVQGYRPQTQANVDKVNRVKALGEEMRKLTDDMRNDTSLDQRAVSIGINHLQTGCMWLSRSVFQPTSFA